MAFRRHDPRRFGDAPRRRQALGDLDVVAAQEAATVFFRGERDVPVVASIRPLLTRIVRIGMRSRAADTPGPCRTCPGRCRPGSGSRACRGRPAWRPGRSRASCPVAWTCPSRGSRAASSAPRTGQLVARRAGIVRDDRTRSIHHAHEIMDHAVGIQRRLVGGERGPPLGQPGVLPARQSHRRRS